MAATLADVHPDNSEFEPVMHYHTRDRTLLAATVRSARYIGTAACLAVLAACSSASAPPIFQKPAGSTTIAAMALVSEGTVFSHGLDPIVELHTYDFAGRLLPDGTVFDAPVTISSAGGAGCVVTPALTAQSSVILAVFIGGGAPPNCDSSLTNYGISATATSPLSNISGGLLSAGPVNPFRSFTIRFVGFTRVSASPMPFEFAPPQSSITTIQSTTCPQGVLNLNMSALGTPILTVAPLQKMFSCQATFNSDAFPSFDVGMLTIISS